MAQEKEFLKESISDLQNIVYSLESDNSALNSTLQLVSTSNQQFRQTCIVGVLTGIRAMLNIAGIFIFKSVILKIKKNR